ncbi:MAG: lysine--tRNA ligase, partial [Pseudomonadota bacterium]
MSDSHASAPVSAPEALDENQLILERREKLKAIRQRQTEGHGVAFPNDFKPSHQAAELFAAFESQTSEELAALGATVKVAGRMMLKRVMGKASFCTLQDASFGPTGGRIQVYVKGEDVGTDVYADFKHWDLGDIVAAEGTMFKTKTGELSIHATRVRLLTKSLRPMPDKFHGIADQEVKYRQRYIDLMTDETTRKRFVARSKAVSGLREFMVHHGF